MLMSSFFCTKMKIKRFEGLMPYMENPSGSRRKAPHVLNLCYSLMVIVNLKHVQMRGELEFMFIFEVLNSI